MSAVIDIPALKTDVANLLEEYRKKPVLDISDQEIPILENIRRLIGQCVISVLLSDPAEWKRQGIRIVHADPSKAFGGCFCDAFTEKDPKILGEGAFGKVYSTHKYPCAHAPADGTQVAIKMEELRQSSWNIEYQSPAGVRRAIDISKKAAQLGVGPALYDTFLCISPDQKMHIVKVMEMFDGQRLSDITSWKSLKHKDAARMMLMKHIKTLNKHGIIHADLHSGNVMVHKDKRGYVDRMVIIDYDRAKFVNTFESANALRILNGGPLDITNLSDNSNFLNFVIGRLLKEGKIVLTRPSAAAKRKTPKRKTEKANSKTLKKRSTKNNNIL